LDVKALITLDPEATEPEARTGVGVGAVFLWQKRG